MINKVIKRDGRQTTFSERRIREAISQAMRATGVSTYGVIDNITSACVNAVKVKCTKDYITVEEIQDIIIEILKSMDLNEVAKNFVEYRKERTAIRETKSHVMKAIKKIGEETSRDNANVGNNFSAKLLQIASVANKWANLASMPKEHAKAHEEGDIHIHDIDSFNLTINCLNVDTEKALKNGFNTGYGTINSPKRVESAANVSCILLQSTQNDMFGGQSHVDFDNAMAEYVNMTANEVIKEIKELGHDFKEADIINISSKRLDQRVSQAMQAVVYNLNTMHSRAGSQVPFSSLNIGIPRDMYAALACEHLLKEYNKGLGNGEQPIFPNIIFRVKEGVNANPGDPYYYLYELACEVAANRMNPTFLLLDAPTNKVWYDKGIVAARMGCRTRIMENINGEEGPASRGNNFPVTINLPRLGIEAKKDWKRFYNKLGSMMDLCYDQLMYRYEIARKLKVKDLPFVAGQGLIMGAENLNSDDSIEPILKHGTMGIGFIGLAETLVAMMGVHHGESQEALEKGLEISQFMFDKIQEYKKKSHLNFGLYHTPAEGLAGRFTPMDRKRYGAIEGVTDKDYYTNSVHIPVYYNIGSVDKIVREGKFHKHGTAGNIAYIEIDGGDVNSRKEFIMKHLEITRQKSEAEYVAYNFHIRTCRDCGTRIESEEQFCPNCGSSNIQGVTRVTGYMSLDERFGPGKKAERADRIKHS